MKKQILTFAALAMIAVGAAFAGTANKSKAAMIPSKDFGTPDPCINNVECQYGPSSDCELNGKQQTGAGDLGDCNEPLERIQ